MRIAAGERGSLDGNHCLDFNAGVDEIELPDDDGDDNGNDDDNGGGGHDGVRERARAQLDAGDADAGDGQPAESSVVHLSEDHGSVRAQEEHPAESARPRDRRQESPRQGVSVQEFIDEDELGRA